MIVYKNREKYLQKIRPFMKKDLVKVLLGQRRSGKSYIMLSLIDELKKNGVDEAEIVYINKELVEWDDINDYKVLYEKIRDYKYIFIDEIQEVTEWERAIRSLIAEKGHDIYITGSNAKLLSSELSTYLSGRYVSFEIFPLTFHEFLTFHGREKDEASFLSYIQYGGLPYIINLGLSDTTYSYLKDVFNTIVLKDVISRYGIRNIDFYKKLIIFLAKHLGSIFSAKSISDFLKNQNIKLLANVILEYIDYSKNSLFLREVPRYDIKGKRLFEIRQKYFFTDIGLRNAMLGGFSITDISGILENVVYINLIANGWAVKIGEIGDREVDFVCEKGQETMYVQVCYLLESEKTIEREFSAFDDIKDNWKKYVISMDRLPAGTRNGIEHRSVMDFIYDLEEVF